ncbi:MAG: type II toxin-antitoxin system death-on-curing family toxin [Clostridia bacterium]|nr:type II toxin-antitoxin system death-on-curing family toxin [Clostridia bacterium]
MIWLPSLEHILLLHDELVKHSGGSKDIRDIGLVESALARASASYEGYELYPGVAEKAAAVCCGLVQNHGFVDGNKRIGVAAMLLILKRNHVDLHFATDDLVWLGLAIARGDSDIPQVIEWIDLHK